MSLSRLTKQNHLYLLLGLIVGSLIIECSFRIIELTLLWKVLPVAEISLFKPDYYSGYRLRENAEGIWTTENRTKIKISSIGLRDNEINNELSDMYRVVMVGDSIAEALQVDLNDTFQSLLERKIKKLEVINLSMSGAVPSVQVALMKHYGTNFNANAMLYIVDGGDFDKINIQNSSGYPKYMPNKESYSLDYSFRDNVNYQFRTSKAGQLIYWMLSHSRLALIVNSRKNRGLFPKNIVQNINVHTNNNESCSADLQATMNSKWDLMNSYDSKNVRNVFLRDIAAISNKNSTKTILAMRNIHGCIDNNSQELHEFVKKILDGYDIGFVDLDYELYQLSNSYPERFPKDKLKGFKSSLGYGHLNEKGHEAYSEILKVKLKKFLML